MKAIVYTGPRTLELLDVAEPQAAPGEVVIEVAAVGICGSEIHGVASQSPFRVPPLIMGHEFSGIRVDTGEPVVANPLVTCGECDLCRDGTPQLCRTRAIIGIHRPGAYAERVAVPVANLVAAPDTVELAHGALVEPLANAVHAWRLVRGRTIRRAGIIGAGAIGLMLLAAAGAEGVDEVDVADVSAARRERARAMGATATPERLDGEYDVVFDAVGRTVTRDSSLQAVRPGGAAVWLGLHQDEARFDANTAIRTERSILPSFGYTEADFATALALVHRVDASVMSLLPIGAGVEVFTDLMDGRDDIAKAVLVP